MTSTPPRNTNRSGLSLLDNSPLSDDDDEPNQEEHPYQGILALAKKWKAELEEVRDSIYWIQVQNSQLLDALTMAGAEVGGTELAEH